MKQHHLLSEAIELFAKQSGYWTTRVGGQVWIGPVGRLPQEDQDRMLQLGWRVDQLHNAYTKGQE